MSNAEYLSAIFVKQCAKNCQSLLSILSLEAFRDLIERASFSCVSVEITKMTEPRGGSQAAASHKVLIGPRLSLPRDAIFSLLKQASI